MKVYFVGAGPGAIDLLTVRGMRLLERVPMVLYAGSLVPKEILGYCRQDAQIFDTSGMDLEEQEACYRQAQEQDIDVVRLHSGDPAIYGATAEQMRRLEKLGIDYEIVPGVSSFTAAAAAAGKELTKPTVSQTVILTRVSGKATAVPELEALDKLAVHQSTMCIFLSGLQLKKVVPDLLQHYAEDTPAILVYRATWPDERLHRSTLGRLLDEVQVKDWQLTSMLMVGAALGEAVPVESSLYAADFAHIFRNKKTRGEKE
jgi:precorrin-4/cobalt-precorrin-4 C11-methyltransferase